MKKGVVFWVLIVGMACGSGGSAWATPLLPGYDLFETPAGGATTITTPFGLVELQGKAIGPFNTDTIVQRTNPSPNPIPSNTNGTFEIELVALSLVSVAPINIGGGVFADLYVTINKLGIPGLPQPDPLPPSTGKATITSHNDSLGSGGGGTFESFFDIFTDLIITVPGSDPNNPANWLTPPQVFQDRFTQTGGIWSHTPRPDDPHNAQFPAGNFYPGVDPVTLGKVLTPEQALLAQHGVLPAQTPEPSTIVLFGAGLAGLVLLGRKRLGKKV